VWIFAPERWGILQSPPLINNRASQKFRIFLERESALLFYGRVIAMNLINVAIFGASGYSGEELVRRLAQHPRVRIVGLTSRQHVGKKASDLFPWLDPRSRVADVRFASPDAVNLAGQEVTAAFLALPHGVASEFVSPLLDAGIRVLDLSADFRTRDAQKYREFYHQEHPAKAFLSRSVYGLPEVHRDQIRTAELVACPGCYPTSILLLVLPLVRSGLIRADSIIANSLSGVSGAGRKAEISLLFVECNESVRPYGLPLHRHLSEIEQEISLAAGRETKIQFAPHLIPLNRGIVTTIHADGTADEAQISEAYTKAYGNDRFVRLLGPDRLPDVKDVAHSNAIEIAWRIDPRTGKIILMSALDNLVKGAAGQAIQCLNIMQGWEEDTGLS
jgi:N-acetyl-gamma-glutamyl-phosphate reductase